MNKKYIRLAVVVGILFILVVSLGTYQHLRTTTFKEILPESVSEIKAIEQITIRYCTPEKNATNDKTMTLKDQSEIQKIVTDPKNMQMKRTSKKENRLYVLEFKLTEERPRLLFVNEKDTLTISSSLKIKQTYQVKGHNHLVEAIEKNKDKWESIAKDVGSIESGTLYHFCS